MSQLLKNKKKLCEILNYTVHLFILASTFNGCVSISAFASLNDITGGIKSFAIGLKICTITSGNNMLKEINTSNKTQI